MAKSKKELKEELDRYLQINSYVNEQFSMGGLSKYGPSAQKEMQEQDLDPDAAAEELEGDEEEIEGGEEEVEGGEEDLEAEGGEEDLDLDTETEIDTTDGTEIDVTDLVSGQEEIKKDVEADKDLLSKNTKQLDSLLSKLEDLETQLGGMDDMVTQIEKIEQKIEKYRPKTQEEKLESRKYDSGPYNQSLVDFYKDNEDRFEKSGKDEYILTGKDIENYNQSDIKQSFNVD